MADPRIHDYIKSARALSQTDEQIWSALLSSGFSVADIQAALAEKGTSAGGPEKAAASNAAEPATHVPIDSGGQPEGVHKTKIVSITVTIGALLIGAGVFTFIAGNWQALSRIEKLVIIVAAMIVSYGVAYLLSLRGLERSSRALYLLGALMYGAGIFLVAQMFQVRALWPDGFLLWMLGVIPLAWILGYIELFLLAAAAGTTGVFGYPFEILNTWSGHNPFLLTSSVLLFLSAAVALAGGFFLRARLPEEMRSRF